MAKPTLCRETQQPAVIEERRRKVQEKILEAFLEKRDKVEWRRKIWLFALFN